MMGCQPVCTIIPDTMPSKALENERSTTIEIAIVRLGKSDAIVFQEDSLGLNGVPGVVEWVAHYVSKRVV